MVRKATVQEINARLARRINREARSDPKSPYAGKYVGIANGKVVVVADSLREMMEQLKEIEPDPRNCHAVDTAFDYETTEELWSPL